MTKELRKFISILPRRFKGLAVKSILKSGMDVWIEDAAYDQDGKELAGYVSIYTSEDDVREFWTHFSVFKTVREDYGRRNRSKK